jgi:hypothetical protein
MRKKTVALLAGTLSAALFSGGCGPRVNECSVLPKPHRVAVDAAKKGYEVEKDGLNGTDCQVTRSGVWRVDRE